MSIAASRAAVVAALSSVPGVSATPHTPGTITAFCAWPVLASATPRNYCIDEATWYVFVALPAGNNAASVGAGDEMTDAVLPAFKPIGKVTAVEPWSWPVETGGATVPVIRITVEV